MRSMLRYLLYYLAFLSAARAVHQVSIQIMAPGSDAHKTIIDLRSSFLSREYIARVAELDLHKWRLQRCASGSNRRRRLPCLRARVVGTHISIDGHLQ